MFRWHHRLFAVALMGLMTWCGASRAWPKSGYIPLFTGGELTGWRYGKAILHKATETNDKRFYVKGDVLVLGARDKNNKKPTRELFTIRGFSRDFELKLEFKASSEAIGYVTVREKTVIPVADFRRRNDRYCPKSFRDDEWNELAVTVKMAAHANGKRLKDTDLLEASFVNGKAEAKVNGQPVDPNAVIIRVEAFAKINGEPFPYPYNYHVVQSKGPIGIRTNTGKIEFRNIRFRELP